MFKKAERKQVKLKIALTGPSGSGKTYSALILAHAMGKKIAVIDTEKESASLYADRTEEPIFEFDTAPMSPPYLVMKYIKAINAAVAAGFDVLIIDSITHAWLELLNEKEKLDSSGRGNGYTNWAPITKKHEEFKAALLNSDIHIIVTMRSKQDYILTENEKGKQAPKKVGMAPIQRDGMEYEFTCVLDISMDHNAVASKDRTGVFDGIMEIITEDTGKRLMAWLAAGKVIDKPTPQPKQAVPAEAKPSIPATVKKQEPELTPIQKEQNEMTQELTKAGMNDFEIMNLFFSITGKRKDHWAQADLEKVREALAKLGYGGIKAEEKPPIETPTVNMDSEPPMAETFEEFRG